jgi:ATP-dependent RNA helicase RhlE
LTGEAYTFVAPDEEGDLRAIERAIGKTLPRVTLPDFDYKARSQSLEIPLKERIAAIRARKAEERGRAKANAERRAVPQSRGPGSPGHTPRPAGGGSHGQSQRPSGGTGHGHSQRAGAGDQRRPGGRGEGAERQPGGANRGPRQRFGSRNRSR